MNLPTMNWSGLAWSQIWQVTALAAVVGVNAVCLPPPPAPGLRALDARGAKVPDAAALEQSDGVFQLGASLQCPAEHREPVAGGHSGCGHAGGTHEITPSRGCCVRRSVLPRRRVLRSGRKPPSLRLPESSRLQKSIGRSRRGVRIFPWTTIAAAVWLLARLSLAGNWLWKWLA